MCVYCDPPIQKMKTRDRALCVYLGAKEDAIAMQKCECYARKQNAMMQRIEGPKRFKSP
jgi:hypothetical protein